MKALVAIKRVIDYDARIQIKEDQSGINTSNIKMSINPFDEVAVEEAVRLKEIGVLTEIVVISCGTIHCQEILKTALCFGADRAILALTDVELQPLSVAKILKLFVEKENPSLVITGKQAIDDDNNQTGQMLAGLLKWSQATFVSKINFISKEKIVVNREVDDGIELSELNLPTVITVDLNLNEPRYLTLSNIIKAKKKQLDIVDLNNFNIDIKPRIKTLKIIESSKTRSGIIVSDLDLLIKKLKNEHKVI